MILNLHMSKSIHFLFSFIFIHYFVLSIFRKDKARKVEFDFDAIRVLGFKFNLKKGKAAELGAKIGRAHV